MKKLLTLLSLSILLVACDKDEDASTPLKMRYVNLHDYELSFGRSVVLDLDSNGSRDLVFGTRLVGDPLYQLDKKQWLANGGFYTNFPVNQQESTPPLSQSDLIPVKNFNGNNWYNASSVILAEKRTGLNGQSEWQGNWKDAVRKFFPIQLVKQTGVYNGWIEMSFDTDQEKLILHAAAICLNANRDIRAGE